MRERRRRFEEQIESAVRERPAVLPTDAVLALQRTAGNQATCRAVLQRALMSKATFVGQPVGTTTIQGRLRRDQDLQAIADALERYANPGTTPPLTLAQQVSALCKQWLANHPVHPGGHRAPAPAQPAWGARPSATNPDVADAIRLVVKRLHAEVQQELLDLASASAHGGYSVFKEQTRPGHSAQTPDAAKQISNHPRHGGPMEQQHWEGWKIHVSVPPSLAGDVAAAVVPQLEQEGSWYKVRERIDEYRSVGNASAGKFIVIYPDSIAHLEQLLTRLESTLPALVGNAPAPAINGDVQLDAGGYVWARYGVFLNTTHEKSPKHFVERPDGEHPAQYSVIDPVQGGWVEDPRTKAIPAAWANHLLGQIRAIRGHRHTQALRDAEPSAH